MARVFRFSFCVTALSIFDTACSFRLLGSSNKSLPLRHPISTSVIHAIQTEEDSKVSRSTDVSSTTSAEKTTEKYGLEAGLFQSLKSNDGESAKSLLAKYGVAYLATSIPLALISFTLCYYLVDNGVDVGLLLSKVGITAGDTGEKAGTFAIAYAAHKAASPIRFPPTVVLTPVMAKFLGKDPNTAEPKNGGGSD